VTVNKARTHLLALWRFAAQRRLLLDFPDVARLPVPENPPEAWSAIEIRRLLDSCRKESGTLCGILSRDWWVAIHHVWLCGGERTTATLSLRWKWTRLGEGTITIPGAYRKWGKSATYSLSPDAVDALEWIRQPARDLVFPWPLHITSFYKHYRRILSRAGLELDHAGPQKMRRSFASHLEAGGGNATEALQHSNRSVTKQSYLDPRITGTPQHWKLLPRIDGPGPIRQVGEAI